MQIVYSVISVTLTKCALIWDLEKVPVFMSLMNCGAHVSPAIITSHSSTSLKHIYAMFRVNVWISYSSMCYVSMLNCPKLDSPLHVSRNKHFYVTFYWQLIPFLLLPWIFNVDQGWTHYMLTVNKTFLNIVSQIFSLSLSHSNIFSNQKLTDNTTHVCSNPAQCL